MWRVATLAELALHEQLMGGCDPSANVAARLYARVAAIGGASHSASVVRQLVLLRDAGDPPEVIGPLLALFDRGVG